MEPRALVQLFNISGAARTPVIAEGLPAIAEHVAVLTADAALLRESGRHRSAKVIELLADEQAGLAMMLFDIVRAEKIANDRLAALQRRFYDHRARAIYVAAYEARLDDLVEAQRHVDSYRDRRYLDGPNDVDWIMYNELDHHRESSLYVDLVADSENRFELRWQSPRHSVYAETTSMSQRPSRAVTLLLALDAIGVTSLAGVEAPSPARRTWTSGPQGLSNARPAALRKAARHYAPRVGDAVVTTITEALAEQSVVVPGAAKADYVISTLAQQLLDVRNARADLSAQFENELDRHPPRRGSLLASRRWSPDCCDDPRRDRRHQTLRQTRPARRLRRHRTSDAALRHLHQGRTPPEHRQHAAQKSYVSRRVRVLETPGEQGVLRTQTS